MYTDQQFAELALLLVRAEQQSQMYRMMTDENIRTISALKAQVVELQATIDALGVVDE